MDGINPLHNEIAQLRQQVEQLQAELEYFKQSVPDEKLIRLQNAYRLTQSESRMLNHLLSGRLLTNGWLMDNVCPDANNSSIVGILIMRIRRKIAPHTIKNVWGQGFQIVDKELLSQWG